MTLHIKDLTFHTVIGILDHERKTPQKVVIQIEINYDYQDVFLNYASVAHFVQKMMQKEQFELIETALLTLFDALKKEFPPIKKLFIEIAKPDIIEHCTVGVSHSEKFL